MNEANQELVYTDEAAFKEILTQVDNEHWFDDIWSVLEQHNIYFLHMVLRITKAGISTYTDILGHSDSGTHRLEYMNNTLQYFKTNGTSINSHIITGIKDGKYPLKDMYTNGINNHPQVGVKLKKNNLVIIKHNKFDYESTIKNKRKSSHNTYIPDCLKLQDATNNSTSDDRYLHYISLSVGKEPNKSHRTLDSEAENSNGLENQEIISNATYYGFGSSLFYVSNNCEMPSKLQHIIFHALNKELLDGMIKTKEAADEQRKRMHDEKERIIKEMKDISEYVEKAQAISNQVQARLDNFGEVFSNWFTHGIEKVYTNDEDLGKSFTIGRNMEVIDSTNSIKGSHKETTQIIERLLASTSGFFVRTDHLFIKLLSDNKKSKGINSETLFREIKKYYSKIARLFPLELMLFFFNKNQMSITPDSVLDLKNTDLSHTAIINGLNKLFFESQVNFEQIQIEKNHQYLFIKLKLETGGPQGLFNTLIDQHNKVPSPHHRATTYVIRQLMGLDANNIHIEGLANISSNTYKTGPLGKNEFVVEASFESDVFQLKYLLRKKKRTQKPGD
jgi:hypothetical protein